MVPGRRLPRSTTLYETLVMMTGGAIVATLGFLVAPLAWWPVLIGASLSIPLLVVVDPKVFPKISALVSVPFKGVGPDALPHFTPTLGRGVVLFRGGLDPTWFQPDCRGLRGGTRRRRPHCGGPWSLAAWPWRRWLVSPWRSSRGLGGEEGILMATLQPALGADTAVVAAASPCG